MRKSTNPKRPRGSNNKPTDPKRSEKSATPDGKPAGTTPPKVDYTTPDSFLAPGEGKEWSANDPNKPLTFQQWAFVTEYMIDFNAGAAMTRAGYPNNTHATRLMKAQNIRKHIARVLSERYAANRLTADKMLAAIVNIVDANLGDFLDWSEHTIKLKSADKIPHEKRALLAELKQGEMGGWSIKLHDKLAAIEKGMKHLGLYDKGRQAASMPSEITRNTLKAVRAGTMTVDQAILDLDMEGISIPDSLRILAARQKADDGPPDDGSYSPVSPEEMASRAARRREQIESQKKTFLPERQADVQAIKEELGQGAFGPEK